MTKNILLIDREFGAGGSTIGEMIAKRLNWKLFDHALSEEIARLAKIPVDVCKKHEERTDPLLNQLINIIWKGSFIRAHCCNLRRTVCKSCYVNMPRPVSCYAITFI